MGIAELGRSADYLDRCLSSLASFFFFRFSSLSFFVKGLGLPCPLASPLILLN
jgi:hypothetical protein